MLIFYLAAIETQKDRDLFTSLYTEHKGFMFNVANRVLGDPHAAENIVHDAFIRMIENLDKFNLQNGHKTKGLIGIIVDGLAKNEYKRRKRMSVLDDEPEEILADPACIDDQIIEQEQYEKLRASIKQLDSIYSHALLLRYEYRYSIKEIAELNGVSEDTIRQRIHRAKTKLRGILQKEGTRCD